MTVLKIIGIIVAIASIIKAISIFNSHCAGKFHFKFFSTSAFIVAALSVWICGGGYEWYKFSLANNEDTLNGIILMTLSLIILIGLIYYNFKKTNFLYGLIGTILQIGLFIPIACLSAPLIIVMVTALIIDDIRSAPIGVVK